MKDLDWRKQNSEEAYQVFKQAFCHTKVGCLNNIAKVVEKSAVVNHAYLVGTQDIVPTHEWAQYFDRPFQQKGIKAM